ncbi:pectate lyase C [Paraphaeosphaeria sporulosa]
MKTTTLAGLLALVPGALAYNAYTGGLPVPTSTKTNSKVIEVKAGQAMPTQYSFSAQAPRFATSSSAKSKPKESIVTAPGTSSSCGSKTSARIAITIKNDVAGQQTNIVGGGAYHASDKVVQHNGWGKHRQHLQFYVEDYGKLYWSCGNCSKQCKRNV